MYRPGTQQQWLELFSSVRSGVPSSARLQRLAVAAGAHPPPPSQLHLGGTLPATGCVRNRSADLLQRARNDPGRLGRRRPRPAASFGLPGRGHQHRRRCARPTPVLQRVECFLITTLGTGGPRQDFVRAGGSPSSGPRRGVVVAKRCRWHRSHPALQPERSAKPHPQRHGYHHHGPYRDRSEEDREVAQVSPRSAACQWFRRSGTSGSLDPWLAYCGEGVEWGWLLCL